MRIVIKLVLHVIINATAKIVISNANTVSEWLMKEERTIYDHSKISRQTSTSLICIVFFKGC